MEKARAILNDAPAQSYFTCFCRECGWGGSSQKLNVNGYDRDWIACPECYSEKIESEDAAINDLKRLVESLDRFNKFEDKQEALDAIDDAPEGATDYRKLSCGTRYIKQGPRFFEYWNGSEWCRPTVPFTVETHILRFDKLEDLKQSIKDHESIYGGGDE
ncbi:TPA: hypothetical protein ACJKZR_001386 [Acinetobacter baumannii]|uniref:hypothetical protein n=1 Tax=Acinetobacter baumannii TaxID=470 RepID=UPI00229E06DE|nr:hypothetical protein [Acinetobacter baumannii]EKW8719721.1 hypothetical protein [Acinetobacter baumannii]ELB7302463.1 hypothetical protein [Acinetobacter baumannii]ELH1395555.1 hypothetical protein [Acinetobacter baumannii]ELH1446913.1 hypothetical protein [Acinetobacter baumannii]